MRGRMMGPLIASLLASDLPVRGSKPLFRNRKPRRKRGPINRTQEEARRRRQIESGMLRPNCRDQKEATS